jgi:excisionase family DNA binding protein
MDELFTIREVAEKFLKISVSSVYRYVENGSFPHIKIGSNIRISKSHIADFLSGNQEKNCPEKTNMPTLDELQKIYEKVNNKWEE